MFSMPLMAVINNLSSMVLDDKVEPRELLVAGRKCGGSNRNGNCLQTNRYTTIGLGRSTIGKQFSGESAVNCQD
jgi:hypothetical protein